MYQVDISSIFITDLAAAAISRETETKVPPLASLLPVFHKYHLGNDCVHEDEFKYDAKYGRGVGRHGNGPTYDDECKDSKVRGGVAILTYRNGDIYLCIYI